MATNRMTSWFPTTTHPLIVSAPMAFVATPKLAAEVTKAGGLGFIPGPRDYNAGSSGLKTLDASLTEVKQLLGRSVIDEKDDNGQGSPLPVGVGFLTFPPSVEHWAETTNPVLQRHRPAVVWLFAPSAAGAGAGANKDVIRALRSVGDAWGLKVVVQVGTVAAARQAVTDGADVVVAQAADAGGHQFVNGSGLVSLVPEVADMLAEEFPDREVALWAAGGIADGRGVAAALALGAEGAVLGTRFIVASESEADESKKQAVLSTSDGGANTVKSYLHDHISGNFAWPELYNGRAIINATYSDQQAGVPLEENTKRFSAAKDSGDNSRIVAWSGTGVGLVKEALPAGVIVKKLREEANKTIDRLKAAF
ncbi:2-nitropropane dioxygenase [Xylariales sp. PMI_506]|nr:2-nitropropane dioxygenase [Xylariales sp. PMI_506]